MSTSVIAPVNAPLIVTALMGAPDFAYFDGLRRQHFPPERNFIPAHITLFHHLPPARLGALRRLIDGLVRKEVAPAARIAAPYSLGRGVAFRIEAPGLLALRERVADHFAADLTPQDRQPPRLHITIQNKVDPATAKVLLGALAATFVARPLALTGIAIWAYRGGPWERLAASHFSRAAA